MHPSKWDLVLDSKPIPIQEHLLEEVSKLFAGDLEKWPPQIEAFDEVTGKKLADKMYYWHTGHPGGIKERRAGQVLEGRFPERVLEKAIERMIPRGPLGRQQMRNLRIFAGAEHPHEAQNPEVIDLASRNRKNKVGA